MEEKKVNLIAASSIVSLSLIILVTRLTIKLSKTFYFILGADIALIVAIFACLVMRRYYSQRRRLLESEWISEGRELKIEYSFLRKVAGVPTKFRYKEIEEATDNFQALLGRGASASVFKGILTDGTEVAVKRIDGGQDHGDREFKSEVSAIAGVQHVNLVRLLGYCYSSFGAGGGGPRFLVYDFIPNGSLDCWIFPRTKTPPCRNNHYGGCLPWDLRFRVATDVARALCYLHHDCRSRILHLDVKPENILIDENFRGIVADFGLSKLMGKDESRVVTTIRGTRGYLAPEWLLGHGVTEKSDIYSYGMVLLEIIGGRRNVCLMENGSNNDNSSRRPRRKWCYFPKLVTDKLREGRLMEVVDRRLLESGGIDERKVKRMVYVALWCIQERARLRPSMQRVVEMLEGHVVIEEPPDTEMMVVDLLAVDDEEADSWQMDGQRNGRGNWVGMTDTELERGPNLPTTSVSSFTMSVVSPR